MNKSKLKTETLNLPKLKPTITLKPSVVIMINRLIKYWKIILPLDIGLARINSIVLDSSSLLSSEEPIMIAKIQKIIGIVREKNSAWIKPAGVEKNSALPIKDLIPVFVLSRALVKSGLLPIDL